jgi:hypothetical protein
MGESERENDSRGFVPQWRAVAGSMAQGRQRRMAAKVTKKKECKSDDSPRKSSGHRHGECAILDVTLNGNGA